MQVLPKRDRGVLKLPPLHPQKEEAILEVSVKKKKKRMCF